MILTTREQEVLKLITFGMNNPEIADKLNITKDTVKIHVSSILRKLKAKNRAQAVLIASKEGLI